MKLFNTWWIVMWIAAMIVGFWAGTLLAIAAQHDGPEQAQQRAAQVRPFNVYESGYYCVFVASNQAGIAIAVMANPGALLLDEIPPCE